MIFPYLLPIPTWNLLNSWCFVLNADFYPHIISIKVGSSAKHQMFWWAPSTEVAAVVQEYDRLLATWRSFLLWHWKRLEHVGMLRYVESIRIVDIVGQGWKWTFERGRSKGRQGLLTPLLARQESLHWCPDPWHSMALQIQTPQRFGSYCPVPKRLQLQNVDTMLDNPQQRIDTKFQAILQPRSDVEPNKTWSLVWKGGVLGSHLTQLGNERLPEAGDAQMRCNSCLLTCPPQLSAADTKAATAMQCTT